MAKKRVLLGLSGGLDSAAAARILKSQGYDILGVFMRLGLDSSEDEAYARQTCEFLGVEFYPVNVAENFQKEIIQYFVDSYARGLTPNPCIKCNQVIKFRELVKLADVLGIPLIATGHYARIKSDKKGFRLFRGRDRSKDQSYFLYRLSQSELARILFPLGEYSKEYIKSWAQKKGLVFNDSESQDICFIPGDHNEFLKNRIDLRSGPIKTLDGRTVGEHKGLPLYTIGQRRGVDVGGIGPLYVVKPDYKNNILYVTDNSRDPALFNSRVVIKDVNWISGSEPDLSLEAQAITRYGQKEQVALVKKASKGAYMIEFSEKQRAITPGQSAVIYQEDEVIGGGVIDHTRDKD